MTPDDPFVRHVAGNSVEQDRYRTLKQTMKEFQPYLTGKRVLDFGASYGLSACAMLALGAREVVGVEPEAWRVDRGHRILQEIGAADRVSLYHVHDTRHLAFADGTFDTVVANAVFEHIPQPRADYIREVWRVLAPGGTLIVNETPNKYLPADFHTLHVPFPTHWLPSRVAYRVGVTFGRFDPTRTDWAYSGWRGLGYYELVCALPGPYTVRHEMTRGRHRILHALGLPSSLLDPYPCYIIQKPTQHRVSPPPSRPQPSAFQANKHRSWPRPLA